MPVIGAFKSQCNVYFSDQINQIQDRPFLIFMDFTLYFIFTAIDESENFGCVPQ